MKIQKLNETMSLFEAFSPSMPNWLKARFEQDRNFSRENENDNFSGLRGTKYSYWNLSGGRGLPRNNATGAESIPQGKQRGHQQNWEWNLWDWAMHSGLDLNNAKFISGPIPENARDERLKSPNIPFWHLNNGSVDEVYAVGANDDATSKIFNKLFKQTNPKQLKEVAVDFCYVDGSDTNNFNDRIRNLQQSRLDNVKSMDVSQFRQRELAGMKGNRFGKWSGGMGDIVYPMTQVDMGTNSKLDPSGYPAADLSSGRLLPNTGTLRKYANKLNKTKHKKLAKRLEDLAKTSKELWDILPGVMSNLTTSFDNSDYLGPGSTKIYQIYAAFTNIKAMWDKAKSSLDSLIERVEVYDDTESYYFRKYLEDAENSVNKLEVSIKSLQNLLDEYVPEYADWDAEEVEWKDY